MGSEPWALACSVVTWGSSHHSDRLGTSVGLDATEESEFSVEDRLVVSKC